MPIRNLNKDALGGLVLLGAAFLAFFMNNSSLAVLYTGFLSTLINVSVGPLVINKSVLLWINDGLMAVFFLLVALEIKREFIEGKLSTVQQAVLPSIAAIGGMIVPALIYVWFNFQTPANLNGWAIPAATDIAFAIGILALFGARVPLALKVFLLALAILDDLAAILIIALFYTADLSIPALGLAAIGIAVLILFNRLAIARIAPYILVGVFVWVCVLKSGVHATLAGVVIGLIIPLNAKNHYQESPLRAMEHGLHPYVTFLVMPIFAFANAGVSLAGLTFGTLLQPIPLGIAAGLFIGKQIGIFSTVYLTVKLGFAALPQQVNFGQIYGVSLLAGIGFTMSLFIGNLAFENVEIQNYVRVGVLSGSILSALVGYVVLTRTLPKP